MSRRLAYANGKTSGIRPKERLRVADLIDMHNRAVINLADGPWKYYGLPVGDPTNYIGPLPKDYGKCLI